MATLKELTTDNQYALKDAERLQRIDVLYKKMLDKYSFAQHFYQQTNVLIGSGSQQQKELSSLEKLYSTQP